MSNESQVINQEDAEYERANNAANLKDAYEALDRVTGLSTLRAELAIAELMQENEEL